MSKVRDYLLALLFAGIVILAAGAAIRNIYLSFFAPKAKVVTTYTVRPGDTWWGICNDTYRMEKNAQCFADFWVVNMEANGNRKLYPGDVVTITNEFYK